MLLGNTGNVKRNFNVASKFFMSMLIEDEWSCWEIRIASMKLPDRHDWLRAGCVAMENHGKGNEKSGQN